MAGAGALELRNIGTFGPAKLGEILRSTVTPNLHFTKEITAADFAILGTTISPYLFFWQTSQEVENK